MAPDAAVVNLDAAPPPPAAAAPAGAASNNIVSIGGLRLAGTGLSVSDAEQCVMYVGLVWTTILLAPRHSVTRWAATPANSDGMLSAWRGFTTMIVTGYYEKRMAWFPLDRLQLELAATRGSAAPPPDAVAEMARIVYSTLEIIYPIFPSI